MGSLNASGGRQDAVMILNEGKFRTPETLPSPPLYLVIAPDGGCVDVYNVDVRGAATSCVAKKTTCPAGEDFTDSDDSTTDATCTACDTDEFKLANETTATSCTLKKTTCPAGEYLTDSDDSTTDATCTACETHEFKLANETTATSCTSKKTTCPAGEYFTDSDDSTTDASCAACMTDEFAVQGKVILNGDFAH